LPAIVLAQYPGGGLQALGSELGCGVGVGHILSFCVPIKSSAWSPKGFPSLSKYTAATASGYTAIGLLHDPVPKVPRVVHPPAAKNTPTDKIESPRCANELVTFFSLEVESFLVVRHIHNTALSDDRIIIESTHKLTEMRKRTCAAGM
jgi:hypothetical protein